jgi:ferric-dicitrate binding protein FerR (iron transport regulator)
MKKDEYINWDLVTRYLAGETDTKGQEEISEWLQQSAIHRNLYNEIRMTWDQINSMKEMNQFDVNNGWNKLHSRIAASSEAPEARVNEIPQKRGIFFRMSLLKIAAAIAFLVLLGAGTFGIITLIGRDTQMTTVSSGTNDRTQITLPDGSRVSLNAGTKLVYAKNFSVHNREVRLTGEAYFDVRHDADNPFIVYTGKAGIKVLGTSFNVQALKSSGKVEVFVESGSVQLFEAENTGNTITIEPGFIGSLENSSVEKQVNTNENYLAWKTRRLIFNNTELEEVAAGIQNVFKVDVVFKDPSMARCKIGSNFENESLENVLEAICTIYNWKWERKGNRVILSGSGCAGN